MSWAPYVDGYLAKHYLNDTDFLEAPCVDGGILGNDGTVWAATSNLALQKGLKIKVDKDDGSSEDVTINEFDNLKDCMENGGLVTKKGGVYINKVKYVAIDKTTFGEANEFVQYFKTKDGGASIGRTKKGNYVIGIWTSHANSYPNGDKKKPQKQDAYHCNIAVEKLSSFLSENGY